MGIVLDIIILAIVIISAILGYKKGLITLGVHLVATIVAVILTLILYRPIGNLVMKTTTFDEKIQGVIETNVNNIISIENPNKMVEGLIESAKEGMLPSMANQISKNMMYAITAVILFIVLKILISIVSAIANLVAKLPIFNQFNELGGLIYGAVRGIIITYIALMIIMFVNTFSNNIKINSAINDSRVAKFMSEYNVFLMLFK